MRPVESQLFKRNMSPEIRAGDQDGIAVSLREFEESGAEISPVNRVVKLFIYLQLMRCPEN